MDRICFDARMSDYSGIGTYIKNLLLEYGRLGFLNFVSVYGDRSSRRLKEIAGDGIINAPAPVYSVSEQLFFFNKARRGGGIFHSPHYNAPLFSGGKLVVTIHDLTHLKMPETLPSAAAGAYARAMLPLASRRAARIITSSDFVKSDIMEILKTPEEKISVIPLAAGREFAPVEDEEKIAAFREKHKLPEGFILYAGNMKKHKNLDVLLDAYKNLRKKGRLEAPLVFSTAGRPDAALIEKTSEWRFSGSVKFLPFIPDEEMPLLYNAAGMFVFPSKSEGFGLPVLEALACGVPCAASNAASVPEVAGGAAVLCEPESAGDFEEAIYNIMTDSNLRDSLRKKGLARAAGFSWEAAAGETINVYNSCSGDSSS